MNKLGIRTRTIGLFVVLTILASCQKQTEWDVRNYGAIANDSTIVNTVAIQKAIDECSASGGGTVVLKDGEYTSGTILLKNNVTLHIAENAKLMSSINPNDFHPIDPFIDATGQYRGQCLIGTMDVENIAITGNGVIDGNGIMFTPENVKKTLKRLNVEWKKPKLPEVDTSKQNYVNKKIRVSNRPFLIRLVRVKNVTLTDINLRQPAAWTLHFYQCKGFKVDGISIYSHANRNNDGIDIDSSEDGVITNVNVDSGDDAICFKSTSPQPSQNVNVTNCTLSSHWGAIKFGTESMGDFKNITIKNCLIHDTRGGGIKILSVDGANISNIVIDSIQMENVEMPIFIRLGERRLVYRDADRQPVGSIKNVTISNITATTPLNKDARLSPGSGMLLTGTPNHKIGTVTIKNVNIEVGGGGKKEHRNVIVPEDETRYPEFSFFGTVSAYGLYARHIENLTTENISYIPREKDARDEIVLVDVN